jgi:hypothetical protein
MMWFNRRVHPGPPPVLLADHLEGELAVLVYRVADLGVRRDF